MQIPDEIRRCTVFIAYDSAQHGRTYAGTGFLLLHETADRKTKWLVTALHVLKQVRTHTGDENLFVRVNKAGEDASWIPIPLSGWTAHPDEAQDVVVREVDQEFDGTESLFFPLQNLVDDESQEKWSIGPGDEVVVIGLFRQFAETARNIPITRVGFIAAMPEEKVSTKTGDRFAYLVEARSIGGLSGSPTFLYFGATRVHPTSGKFRPLIRPEFALMGLMHGHFENAPDDPLDRAESDAPRGEVREAMDQGLTLEQINSGLAMVIPAPYIRETIERASQIDEAE